MISVCSREYAEHGLQNEPVVLYKTGTVQDTMWLNTLYTVSEN